MVERPPRPDDGPLHRLAGVVALDAVLGALVEDHDHVRAKRALHVDGGFRCERVPGAVEVRLEVDAVGMDLLFERFLSEERGEGPDIDLEMVLITHRIWRQLGLDKLVLQINSLGTAEERAAYRQGLVAYLRARRDELDEDSLRRLESNPLRVLDSKNPNLREVIDEAPALMDHLGGESRAHFQAVRAGLDAAGVAYTVNPWLVRGLDYYARTVFEWISSDLGAQGTVCAGGRYDGLVEQLGGRPTPAIGFAMGLERLVALLENTAVDGRPDIYVVLAGEAVRQRGMLLGEQLRDALPGLSLITHCGGGGLKAQFKRADRSGALYALVLGVDELARGVVGLKPLRGEGEQREIAVADLSSALGALI